MLTTTRNSFGRLPGIVAAMMLAVAGTGCGSGDGGTDSGLDATDAQTDVSGDVENDAPTDNGADERPDAGEDSSDLTTDQGPDLQACGQNIPAPVNAEIVIPRLDGGSRKFSDSGFIPDQQGNLVGVDADGNVVRRKADGSVTVWVEKAVKNGRGIAWLSTGELVIADSGRGMLVKVYGDGQTRILTRHLDAPDGVVVGSDDTIFVSEATRAAVVAVDSASGEYETLCVGLRVGPRGLALSADGRTLFMAGYGNGTVYAMHRGDDGKWSVPERFARIPGIEGPCDALASGDECDVDGFAGTCRPTAPGSVELFCRINGPCFGLEEGAECSGDYYTGVCTADNTGELFCRQVGACEGKQAGDECEEWDMAGTCVDDGLGGLICRAAGVCDGKQAGDECVEWEVPGVCTDDGTGYLVCRATQPCDGKQAGDECVEWEVQGICTDDGVGNLICLVPGVCDGRQPGEPCEQNGNVGVCASDGAGGIFCYIPGACEGKAAGDECVQGGVTGVCQVDEWDNWRCKLPSVCDTLENGIPCAEYGTSGFCRDDGWGGLACTWEDACPNLNPGDSCLLPDGASGACRDDWGYVYCAPIPVCRGIPVGDRCQTGEMTGFCADDLNGGKNCQTESVCAESQAQDLCTDPATYQPGKCLPTNDGTALYCVPDNFCASAAEGDECTVNNGGPIPRQADEMVIPIPTEGRCTMSFDSMMYCEPVGPCEGKAENDSCTTEWGYPGTCVMLEIGTLECQENATGACDYLKPGDVCRTQEGNEGVCTDNGSGYLVCVTEWPCSDAVAGDMCTTLNSLAGTCTDDGNGGLFCKAEPACVGAAVGDACTDPETGIDGKCAESAGQTMICRPENPCAGKAADDECKGRGGRTGVCRDWGQGGELTCEIDESAGYLNGINVDLCGNVYVGDDNTDVVWKISPDGKTVIPAAHVWFAGVSDLVWGNGAGDFAKGSLYAIVGGGQAVSKLTPGLPGRMPVMPHGQTAQPSVEAWQPEIDCMNIPSQPVSTEVLGAPRGFHDVAFDEEGYIIGHDGSNLIRVNRENSVEVYAMGFSTVQGMDWLEDGSLVVATDLGIIKVEPSGAQVKLAADIQAYGVTVGPDGKVYAGDNVMLYRIDPDTRVIETYLDPARTPPDSGELRPRTIGFDLDGSLMYIGSNSESVFVLSIDENFNPVGGPRHFSVVRPGAAYLDGLGVDACGNVFVPNYESSALYRISPDGINSLFLQQDNVNYGHGIEWGNGIGGWKTDAVYLPQPYNENHVIEIVIGVGRNTVTGVK